MARRKKDNSGEIVKLVFVGFFLLALLIAGGDFRKLGDSIALLFFGGIGVAVVSIFVLVGWAIWIKLTRERSSAPVAFTREPDPLPRKTATPDESFAPPEPPPKPQQFTEELLKKLEWRRFELVVEGFFRAIHLNPRRVSAGADGGIDLIVSDTKNTEAHAVVQCKAWNVYAVRVQPIRELFGVMTAEGARHAYFITTGRFTSAALSWAEGKPMTLVTGPILVDWLNKLAPDVRDELLRDVTEGDYQTPSCPSCEIKLLRKTGPFGEFWGCPNYGNRRIRCGYKLKIRKR